MREWFAALEALADGPESQGRADLLHAIKGAASTVGADGLAELAAGAETGAVSIGKVAQALSRMLEQFDAFSPHVAKKLPLNSDRLERIGALVRNRDILALEETQNTALRGLLEPAAAAFESLTAALTALDFETADQIVEQLREALHDD
ncbi:MAG TPA: hypothetical protein DET67_07845 [Ruegeria sp.]|nr:hypothetical protein [Ruegeria sp.]